MELHKLYTFEGTVPMRYTEEASGLDRTYTLHFEASCALSAATASLTEEALKNAIVLSLQPAYMLAYSDGMTAETLQAAPTEALRARALDSLQAALHMLGGEWEQFTVNRHWLGKEDAAEIDAAAKQPDPEQKAWDMVKAQVLAARAKTGVTGILWICQCGQFNDNNFCPECGRDKNSFLKWSCPCGSLNDNRFCPECGRKFE